MLMTQEAEFVTIPQAAKIAHVSRTVIERWIASGKLQKFTRAAGSYPLVRRDQLEAAARIVPAEADQAKTQ